MSVRSVGGKPSLGVLEGYWRRRTFSRSVGVQMRRVAVVDYGCGVDGLVEHDRAAVWALATDATVTTWPLAPSAGRSSSPRCPAGHPG